MIPFNFKEKSIKKKLYKYVKKNVKPTGTDCCLTSGCFDHKGRFARATVNTCWPTASTVGCLWVQTRPKRGPDSSRLTHLRRDAWSSHRELCRAEANNQPKAFKHTQTLMMLQILSATFTSENIVLTWGCIWSHFTTKTKQNLQMNMKKWVILSWLPCFHNC